jgi:hypothetical protein
MLVALPLVFFTTTLTLLILLLPKFGTVAFSVVALTNVTLELAVLLNITVVPAIKFVPLIVSVAPTPALAGVIFVIVGVGLLVMNVTSPPQASLDPTACAWK